LGRGRGGGPGAGAGGWGRGMVGARLGKVAGLIWPACGCFVAGPRLAK
jgi:hypothetical protein